MKRYFMMVLAMFAVLALLTGGALAGGGDDDEDSEGNKCTHEWKSQGDGYKLECNMNSRYCICPENPTSGTCKLYKGSGVFVKNITRGDETAIVEECCDCVL